MELTVQILMGVSLAACAGLRAWLPLLMVSLLVRAHYLAVNPSFAWLAREDALIVFGAATVAEFIGDKVIGLDHLHDAVGTFIRPAAGAVLASSMLTHVDPLAATVLGLIVGGGTSFTIHVGKAALRAKSSLLAPAHGGFGNATLSLGEDFISGAGVWTAAHAPVIAFLVTLAALAGAVWLALHAIRMGKQGMAWLRRQKAGAGAKPTGGYLDPANP